MPSRGRQDPAITGSQVVARRQALFPCQRMADDLVERIVSGLPAEHLADLVGPRPIASVEVAVGDQVSHGQVLMTFSE